jgi:hypothetical protein
LCICWMIYWSALNCSLRWAPWKGACQLLIYRAPLTGK